MKRNLSNWIMKVAAAVLLGLVRAEKRVYFLTGYEGRALRAYWNRSGARLQKALNKEHGTRIESGYITK